MNHELMVPELASPAELNRRLHIGIDVDEVLCDSNRALRDFCRRTMDIDMRREDFKSYYFAEVFHLGMDGVYKLIRDYFSSEEFGRAQPVEGAIRAVEKLGKHHDLTVITSRPLAFEKQTLDWLAEFYPGSFKNIVLTNQWTPEKSERKKTKAEVCRELGVHIIIEDCLRYAKECAAQGIGAYLIDCPWNQGNLPSNIVRVNNWQDIEKGIMGVDEDIALPISKHQLAHINHRKNGDRLIFP